jgi:hypothetical protein
MYHIPHEDSLNEELSDEQKQAWDRIIETLWEYFETSEGGEFYERFISIFPPKPHKPELPLIVLSPNETKAYHFIHKELKRGHSPSVREVAKALGFRSSRSGHRITRSLRGKGLWQ